MHAPYPELSFSFLTEIDKYIIENIFSLYERLHLPLYLPCPFLMAECGILKTSQTVVQATSQMPVWFHQWEAMFEICLWSLGLWVEDQGLGFTRAGNSWVATVLGASWVLFLVCPDLNLVLVWSEEMPCVYGISNQTISHDYPLPSTDGTNVFLSLFLLSSWMITLGMSRSLTTAYTLPQEVG